MTMPITLGHAVSAVTAVVGSVVSFAFGGWSEALTVLLVAMGVDYVTGITAALMRKNGTRGLDSRIGFRGLAMKGLMLLVILLAHRIDILIGSGDIAMSGAIYFYIANELISIAENYGELGLPFPERLRSLIAALRNRDSGSS